MERSVFLIGPRASGKTTLGRALAADLEAGFVDTDALLVQRLGRSVAEFVAARGWEAFRDEETRVLEAVARTPGRVVACGGGIVLRPRNRELLAEGETLYLRADPAVLADRLARDPAEAQRPSLTGRPLLDEIAEVLAARAPLYESCARAVLDASLPLDRLLEAARAALNR